MTNTASIYEKANKVADAIIEQVKVTSVQYALMHKGEMVISGHRGVYSKTENKALTNQTMYGIGSVSKVYATGAAMLLVDQGKVELDKPVTAYIPEFVMADERYKKITVRMLMTHSSGIYGTHFKRGFLFNDNDTFAHDTLLTELKTGTLKYEPGTFSEYCNDGFTLLEILVERVSGLKYNAFLEKNFFAPLGIQNTKVPMDSFDRAQLARVYSPAYDGALPIESTNIYGTGGVYSTAEDMCRFGEVLMGKKILSKASAKAMAQPEYKRGIWPKDDDVNLFGYGLGWDSVNMPPFGELGIQAVCKGGDTMQYHASLICLPEHDMAAAVASSSGMSFLDAALAIELLQQYLKELGITDKIVTPVSFTPPVKVDMPAELEKYAGLYAENGKFVTIEFKDGAFELPKLLDMIPQQAYTYAGDGWFVSPDGSIRARFEEADGQVFLQANIALNFPGIGQIFWKSFLYQKLTQNPIDDKVAAVWKNRADKKYLLVDDKATSEYYLMVSPVSRVEVPVNTEYGYAYGGSKIVDANFAKNTLYFRDIGDLRFRTENGVEYLSMRGFTFMSDDSLAPLDLGAASVKIGADGYARYFRVGDAGAGKTLTVKLPKTGAFVVYDDKNCTNFSTVSGKNSALLAKDGIVAFIGEAGDVFEVSYS